MRLSGIMLSINAGDKFLIEDTLFTKRTLENVFKQLIVEQKGAMAKELDLWRKYEKLAKKQYPEYDTGRYILTWNWEKRELIIRSKEDKGLVLNS